MYETCIPPELLLTESGCYQPLCPVDDEWVPGEIVNRWHHREQSRHLRDTYEREMLEFDAVLAELLFRRKQTLCQYGRGGKWSDWLRQQRISRSTADRLVAQYAETHGLGDELRHREIVEPLRPTIGVAALRAFRRVKKMLITPRSRMTFLSCLADQFGLGIEVKEDGSMLLSLSPPSNEKGFSDRVPNVIQILDDGSVVPHDYRLRDENGSTAEEAESVFF